jgi:hypothetical protein
MSLSHALYELDVFAVELTVDGNKYYFLDLQMTALFDFADGQICWDGVWGRTSCLSSQTPIDNFEFDLTGNLLATDFPVHNLYKI